MSQTYVVRKSHTYIGNAGGTPTQSWNTTTDTANVGSGDNRTAIVVVSCTNAALHPSTCFVGTDELTAVGTEYSDGNTYRHRMFVGTLTVTGAQSLSGVVNTDSSVGGGFRVKILVVQGTAALTFDNLTAFAASTAGSGSYTAERTVTSASGDRAYIWLSDITGGTPTTAATSGSTLVAGSDYFLAVAYKDWTTSTTTTPGIDLTGARDITFVGFTLTEASASSIAPLGGKLQRSILLNGLVR